MAKSKQVRAAKTQKSTQPPAQPKTEQTANLAPGELPPVHLWTDDPQAINFFYACHAATIMAGLDFPLDSEAIQYMAGLLEFNIEPRFFVLWLTSRQNDPVAAISAARAMSQNVALACDFRECKERLFAQYDLPNGFDMEDFEAYGLFHYRNIKENSPHYTKQETVSKLARIFLMTPKKP